MRGNLLPMISPSSLSAFSASAINGLASSGAAQAARAAAPVQQARAQTPNLPVQAGGQSNPSPLSQPGPNTPRGSLLNLVV
jgi:hypothetical protein